MIAYAKIEPTRPAQKAEEQLARGADGGRDSQLRHNGTGSTGAHSMSVINQQQDHEASDVPQIDKQESAESLNFENIAPCSSPTCYHKTPHVHSLKKCTHHKFCGVTDFVDVPATDMNTLLPIHIQMKNAPSNVRENLKTFKEMLQDKRQGVQLEDMGFKCIVTDNALANWYAQSVKIDKKPPLGIGQQDHDKKIKDRDEFHKKLIRRGEEVELQEHIKKSRNRGLLNMSDELHEVRGTVEEPDSSMVCLVDIPSSLTGQEIQDALSREFGPIERLAMDLEKSTNSNKTKGRATITFEKEEHAAKALKKGDIQIGSYHNINIRKNKVDIGKLAIQMAQNMRPMVYPRTKEVKWFQELQDEFNTLKDHQKKSRAKARAKEDVESVSQSSLEGATGDMQGRLSRQMTHKNFHLDSKKRTVGNFIRQENGFDAIIEESRAGQQSLEVSPTAKGGADIQDLASPTLKSWQSNRKREPLRQSQQLRRNVNKRMERQYNPYSAECSKHFEGISRIEIDRLMVKIKKDNELKLKRRLEMKKEASQGQTAQANSMKTTMLETEGADLKSRSLKPTQKVRSEVFAQNKAKCGSLRRDETMRARREQQFRQKMAETLKGSVKAQPYQDASTVVTKNHLETTSDEVASKQMKGSCFQFFQEVTTADPDKDKGFFIRSQTLGPEQATKCDRVPLAKNLVEKLRTKRATSIQGTTSKMAARVKDQLSQAQKVQDFAPNSFMSVNKSRQVSVNDRNLKELIEKKYNYTGLPGPGTVTSVFEKRSTASITGNFNGSYTSAHSSPLQNYRISTSQPATRLGKRGIFGGVHSTAKSRIKNALDSSFLNLDLRIKSRANKVFSHPYASNDTREVKVVDQAKMTPSLLHDLQTLTQEQSRFMTVRTGQNSLEPVVRPGKTINSVSFIQVRDADSPALNMESNNQLVMKETHSTNTAEQQKQQMHDTSAPGPLNSSLKPLSIKRDWASRTDEGQSTGDERVSTAHDATTTQSHSVRTRQSSQSGYYVTPEDYNFEVTEPHKYYQKELFVKLPLYQPKTQSKQRDQDMDIFKSAEFWLSKGYGIQSRAHQTGNRKNANEADNVALDYYLSGVKIDPRHYGCIYNAGCCHFFTGKFENARKWFHLTTLVKPRVQDGYYCQALACLRLGLYEEALQSILKIDEPEETKSVYDSHSVQTSQQSVVQKPMEQSKRFSKNQIILLHAVCCKILEQHEEAEMLYQKLQKDIYIKQCQNMIMTTFSVILVPMQKERVITEQNVNRFVQYMNLYDPEFLYDDSVAKNLNKIGKPNPDLPENKRLQFLTKYLCMFPFFRRIPEQKIHDKFIDKLTFVEKKKGELIVVPKDGAVMIVLNGQIILRHHELDQPTDFDIQAIGKSGHILFAPELDGNSTLPLIWPIVFSTKAQLVLAQRPVFDEMWKDSRNRDIEVALSQLNLNLFFQHLSRQTFFRLINEKATLIRFKPGQLVLPIHPRSPWNNAIYARNQQKQQVILEQMEERNQSVRLHLAAGPKNEMVKDWDALQKQKTIASNPMRHKLAVKMIERVEKNLKEADLDVHLNPSISAYGMDGAQRNDSRMQLSSQESRTISSMSGHGKASSIIKDECSDYQKLVKALSRFDQRHSTANDLKKALKRKKRQAQQRLRDMSPELAGDNQISDYNASPLDVCSFINPYEFSFVRPIMLLYQGSARCINRYFHEVQFVAKRLATGSILGESDTLQRVGVDFLGDVYAEKHGLTCLIIERPDLTLDPFEIKILQEVIGKQQHELINILETRFKSLADNPIRHY